MDRNVGFSMSTPMNVTSEHYKQGVSEIFCVQWETNISTQDGHLRCTIYDVLTYKYL